MLRRDVPWGETVTCVIKLLLYMPIYSLLQQKLESTASKPNIPSLSGVY